MPVHSEWWTKQVVIDELTLLESENVIDELTLLESENVIENPYVGIKEPGI